METEDRVKLIEDAILLMKTLVLRHEERLDDFDEELRKSRAEFDEKLRTSREDFDFKMNAVIDSQIRTESSTSKLEASTAKLEASTSNLKDASRSQLKRIERLEPI